jgi:hypothetical protein
MSLSMDAHSGKSSSRDFVVTDWLTPAVITVTSASQQSEKSPARTLALWENRAAQIIRVTFARLLSLSMRTISATVPEMSSAYAVVAPTKPVPTMATQATRLGFSCGVLGDLSKEESGMFHLLTGTFNPGLPGTPAGLF